MGAYRSDEFFLKQVRFRLWILKGCADRRVANVSTADEEPI